MLVMTAKVDKKKIAIAVAAIAVVIAALVLLLPVFRKYQKRQEELVKVNAQLHTRKVERAELNREVTALQNSPAEIEKVAREKFKLVKEGETLMRYEKKTPQKKEKSNE